MAWVMGTAGGKRLAPFRVETFWPSAAFPILPGEKKSQFHSSAWWPRTWRRSIQTWTSADERGKPLIFSGNALKSSDVAIERLLHKSDK